MTFMPLNKPPGGIGDWFVFSNTTTASYPTGLSDGDVAVIQRTFASEVSSTSGYPAYPTFTAPTGFTSVAQATTQSQRVTTTTVPGADPKEPSTYIYTYFRSTRVAYVGWRTVTGDQSGTGTGGSGSSTRLLIFRNTRSLPSAVQGRLRTLITTASLSQTFVYTSDVMPFFPLVASCRTRTAAIANWTTTFSGSTLTEVNGSTMRTQVHFNVGGWDAAPTITVGSVTASHHAHRLFTLGQ